MIIIRTWDIHRCGWDMYFREVAEVTRGRLDVGVRCVKPLVISIVEKVS